MKTLITTISLLTTLSLSSIAGEYRYKAVQTGSGYTKGDAIASAFMKLPYGSNIKNVGVNGISTYKFVKGAGYVQVRGSYTANIIYSR
jgi:hypothetical protein